MNIVKRIKNLRIFVNFRFHDALCDYGLMVIINIIQISNKIKNKIKTDLRSKVIIFIR